MKILIFTLSTFWTGSIILMVYCFIRSRALTPVNISLNDPCHSHMEINDPTRNVDFGFEKKRLCDKANLAAGWYRFVGSGGNIIATSCVDEYRCNTDAPLWMNGDLPELEEGEVNRTVCASFLDSCCDSFSEPVIFDLRVKQCEGGYYVYYLIPPTACYYRYCTEKSLKHTEDAFELSTEVPSISIVTPVNISLNDPCHSHTEINDPTRNVDNGFGQLCDHANLAAGWYRFVGSGGNIIATSCVEEYHCNTDAPLWMNGDLPELEEGEVDRTVCASFLDSCCSTFSDPVISDLRVKRCEGGYYVYYLLPPRHCFYRYCTASLVVDPCTSHLCQNGECVPKSSTTYECLCDGCWSGNFCETHLDPCASNNCHNDAHCVAISCSEYSCTCEGCWSGEFCTIHLDPCVSNNCHNDAHCMAISCSEFACICAGCWSGEFCTNPLDPCSSNPCPDRAKCFNKSCDEYLCVCEDGWSGEDCNTATT